MRARRLGIPVFLLPEVRGGSRFHATHTGGALLRILKGIRVVRRTIRQWDPAVIHANSPRAGIVAGAATVGAATKCIVHVRDVLRPGALPALVRRFILMRARLIIANSYYTLDQFRPMSTPSVVIPSPIDIARFTPDRFSRHEERAALRLAPGELVLTIVGQITPWKRQDFALEVFKLLIRRRHNCRLLIAGEPRFIDSGATDDNLQFEANLRDEIRRLGSSVVALGHRADIERIYAATDILLQTSKGEPFGRTIVEAMAMGCCVVASDHGGPRETISSETDGFLVDPDDVERWVDLLDRLADDPSLRARVGGNGKQRAQGYAAEIVGRRLADAYEAVIAG